MPNDKQKLRDFFQSFPPSSGFESGTYLRYLWSLIKVSKFSKALLASYNRFFLQKIIEKEENSILLTLHHPALLTSKCTRMMVKLQFWWHTECPIFSHFIFRAENFENEKSSEYTAKIYNRITTLLWSVIYYYVYSYYEFLHFWGIPSTQLYLIWKPYYCAILSLKDERHGCNTKLSQ